MSQPEQQEQGERAIMKPVEAKALQAADAQAAKMAGAADIQAAQALNPDRHSGSAGGDQNQSIEIVAMGKDGRQQVLAARPKEQKQEPPLTPEYLRERAKQDDIWAKKFVADIDQAQKLPSPYRDGHIAKVLKDAEAVYRPTGQAQKPQLQPDQFNTEEMLAQASEKSPAAEAVSLFKQWVEKQPDSPQKEAFRQEVRQQAADLSPEMKDKMEQRAKLWQKVEAAGLDEGGTHKAIRPELANNLTGRVEHNQPLENTADGWLVAGQAIAGLPIEKQAEVIGAGLKAGTEQYQQEERERAIGRLIGSVQGGGQVSVNLAVIAEFSADVVCGNKERAMERGDKFGEAVGQTIVSGVGLFKDADQYLFNVGYSGDYGKPFKDVADLGAALNDRWSQLPPREQERIKYKFITEMVADGVIAGGGAKAIGKAKEFTEVLDAVAEQAAEYAIKHGGKALEASKKAASTIAGAIDDLMAPEMALPGGGKMKFPRDFGKPADKPITSVLMSQADDVGGTGRLVNKGVDAAGKALKFSQESGIEVGELRLGPDKLWDQAPFPRGNDVHVVLGENLPAGTKTIDRVVFRDGIAEGQKSIDLTADTYAFPNRLESKLKGYVHDMELYKGQKRFRMSFRMQQQEIEQKILHIGIKNGSMSDSQKEVFEKIGKQILQYNADLPIGKAPIKLRVTVVK